MSDFIDETVEALSEVESRSVLKNPCRCGGLPNRKKIIDLIKQLQSLLFPLCFQRPDKDMSDAHLLSCIFHSMKAQIELAFCFTEEADYTDRADEIARAFVATLPRIKELLQKDIVAIYEGDPAAKSYEEVLLCYPGFYAISIYRLAHELYGLGVPLLPRIMTEYAHEKTGIDIHAGAHIGEYFFIDHGTGIVVGETTVIGDHVKLYQGVTLGAKSFELDADGNPVKNVKRHPNIGSNVIIYANATILGGETTIGDNCVIGGNTWLTHSVKPGTTVYYNEKQG